METWLKSPYLRNLKLRMARETNHKWPELPHAPFFRLNRAGCLSLSVEREGRSART